MFNLFLCGRAVYQKQLIFHCTRIQTCVFVFQIEGFADNHIVRVVVRAPLGHNRSNVEYLILSWTLEREIEFEFGEINMCCVRWDDVFDFIQITSI